MIIICKIIKISWDCFMFVFGVMLLLDRKDIWLVRFVLRVFSSVVIYFRVWDIVFLVFFFYW